MLRVEPRWKKTVIRCYKDPVRDYKLGLNDMVLMLLLYYRSYISHVFIGYLFGIDDSNVCRIIQKLEPVMAKEMSSSKARCLSKEEVESLVIDATEQPIERPQKGQQP